MISEGWRWLLDNLGLILLLAFIALLLFAVYIAPLWAAWLTRDVFRGIPKGKKDIPPEDRVQRLRKESNEHSTENRK